MDQIVVLKVVFGMMYIGIIQVRDIDGDFLGFYEKAEYFFREWVNMYYFFVVGRDSIKVFIVFV